MGRSEAESILPINNTASYPAKGSKSIKCRNYALGVFVPEAKPRDTKHTVGLIPI